MAIRALDKLKNDLEVWSRRQSTKPSRVFFELTNRCNLKCGFCYNPNKVDQLKTQTIIDCMRDVLSNFGSNIRMSLSGGEPTLHPGFDKIISFLLDSNIGWALSTNGTTLDRVMIEKIIGHGCLAVGISIDGSAKIHDELRGVSGSFDKSFAALRLLSEYQSDLDIHVATTLTRFNVGDLQNLASLLDEIPPGLRWRLNPVKMPAEKMALWSDPDVFMAIVDFYRQYRQSGRHCVKINEISSLTHKYGNYFDQSFNRCSAGASVFGVVANGDVVGCMVRRAPVFGNIFQTGKGLSDIWKSADVKYCKNQCSIHLQSQILGENGASPY